MLDKGTHLYQLVIDGVEQPDPSSEPGPNGFGGFDPSFKWVRTNQTLPMSVEYIPSVPVGNVRQAAGFLGRTAPNAHFYAWWNNEIYGFGQTDSTGLFSLGIPWPIC